MTSSDKQCDKSAPSMSNLTTHLCSHVSTTDATTRKFISDHLFWHFQLDLRPYICSSEKCGKAFKLRNHLTQHALIHQKHDLMSGSTKSVKRVRRAKVPRKMHECPYEPCSKIYDGSTNLKIHIRSVHTKQRPFVCSVCNQAFASQGN